MPTYRLKKDLPDVKAGTMFVHDDSHSENTFCRKTSSGNFMGYLFPSATRDEWLEEVEEDTVVIDRIKEKFGVDAGVKNDQELWDKLVREGLPSLAKLLGMEKKTIDCDAQPWCPYDWAVEEHQKGDQIEFDPDKIDLYLSPNQQDGKRIEGNKLRQELKNKKVMNACVLDHLLANPELIPESWKGKLVFFWGTIYRSSVRRLYVRFLYWDGSAWRWYCRWLACEFDDRYCAAVSA